MLGGLVLQLCERFDRWKNKPYDRKLPSVEAFSVSPKCADVKKKLLTISKKQKNVPRCVWKHNSSVHVCISIHEV